MGKGGKLVPDSGCTEQEYTWEEVRSHSKSGDGWIVIEDKVYDVSRWARKHPGGSRIISHYAGQDASEAFKAFHTNMGLVSKFMKPIEIGKVEPSQCHSDEAMKKDFIELRKTAERMNLFKPSYTFFTFIVAHLIFFEILAYLTMYYCGVGWLPWTVSVIFNTIVQAEAGWSQHDFGHLSVFKNNKFNRLWHAFTMNIIKGASSSWWKHLHNQHHAKPNVIDKDPDVRLEAVFVLGEEIPKRVAKKKKVPTATLR